MGSPMEARMVQRMMQLPKEKRTVAGDAAFEAAIEGRVAEWIADKAATSSATCIGMAVHVREWKEFGGVPQQDRGASSAARCVAASARVALLANMAAAHAAASGIGAALSPNVFQVHGIGTQDLWCKSS